MPHDGVTYDRRMTHCTLVNPLCPNDLCVLPAGHPGTVKREHLLSTMYGSVDPDLDGAPNPKYRERMGRVMFMAPEDTSIDELVKLGEKASRKLERSG